MIIDRPPATRQLAKGLRILRREGAEETARRVARYAYFRLGAARLAEPLLPGDIADSTRLDLDQPASHLPTTQPMTIGWVTIPPALGSGGHTTMFRMVEALESAGHRCRLFVYDRYGGDVGVHEETIRRGWPHIKADVVDANGGIEGVNACVASSWDSAHVLARRGTSPMRRLYFIQDYEPFFYARGSEYALAEDTYRFGFRCIALGEMVAAQLRREIGIEPDVLDFGCDGSVYHLDPMLAEGQPRAGVVCYVRPLVARRASWLGRLALQELHRRRPDVVIHLYGDDEAAMPFPAVRHHRLTPTELNALYNRSVAGLAMSFTNISLVAEEMMAAGLVPVVNESAMARLDLDNANVAWARPTPGALADALEHAVDRADKDAWARAAAASVRPTGWAPAQRALVTIMEQEVYGN